MRIFILVLTPILLALSAGLIWLHTPTVEDKAFLEKLHADTRRVHESQQFVANDPEQNGYLQPVARPIWDGSQRELPGELRLWIDTSSSLKAGKALEAPTRDAYEKAKPLLDALGEAFLKPHFVVPNRPIGAESPVVDMAVLKDCGFAMAGLMEYHASKGEIVAMSEVMTSTFKFAGTLGEGLYASQSLVGLMLSQYALETAVVSVPPDKVLSPDELRILATLAGSYLPLDKTRLDETLRLDLGYTSLVMHGTVDETGKQTSNPVEFWTWKRMEKEVREMDNELVRSLKSPGSGLQDLREFRMAADFYRRRQLGFSLAVGVKCYRTKVGELPTMLEQLAVCNIDPRPDLHKPLGIDYKGGVINVDISKFEKDQIERWNERLSKVGQRWFEVRDGKLVFDASKYEE